MTGSPSSNLKVRIIRLDKTLPLPEYHTPGAVAFDFYSGIAKTIEPGSQALLPSNFIIEVPQGYFLMLAARSSLTKKGLMLHNGIGVIDQDYHGPEDVVKMLLYNFTGAAVTVERGERIAQGLILPVTKAAWEEVDVLKPESRGGFGSTGKV
jgi:dUTP pyrophosphatase